MASRVFLHRATSQLQLIRSARTPRPRAQSSLAAAARPASLEDLCVNFQSPLGVGNFGGVYHAEVLATGEDVAVKLMNLACIPEDGRVGRTELVAGIEHEQLLFDEVLQRGISHPHVVDLVGRFNSDAEEAEMLGLDLPPGAHKEPLHCFVMELLQGKSLHKHVEQSKGLSEDEARRITRVLCEGLHFLLEHGIVHRDVKPDNLHFSNPGDSDAASLKLIDFSTATVVPKGVLAENAVFDDAVGTPGYVAPEVLFTQKNGGKYDAKCDVFSLGCTVHAMLTNMYLPRRHAHLGIVLDKNLSSTLSSEGLDFLNTSLALNPIDRPSISEILHHPWLRVGVE
eukprot:TRINITY_DN6651_c0_g2_i2.p1 TRINITY_DN6651_c0_g2~~TRINITY_DN6651_c0_g2_i2.p1  ORF type:complete len:340 (+),score=66.89 TRINITY_DN6651_c0_g2_i2:38-1057(+)